MSVLHFVNSVTSVIVSSFSSPFPVTNARTAAGPLRCRSQSRAHLQAVLSRPGLAGPAAPHIIGSCSSKIPKATADRSHIISQALVRLTIPEVAATAAALLEPFEHQQLPQSPATAMPGRPSDRAPAKAVSANFVLSKQIYDASVREAERRHCRARTPSPHSGAVVAISRIVPF